ncbi:MAG: ATP-binding cassette domain-containing protein [Ardenticatenaceae bacterium]
MVQNIFSANMRKLFRYRLNLLIASAVGLRRVDLLFQNQIEMVDAPEAIELPPLRRVIRFENVSFGYTTSAYQLNQIDLSIKKGQFVAFVGPSGAGKSTIFNLLLRFYEVCEGRVTIDGVDVRDVTRASLRQQMGVVLQETFIFNATILDNIRVVKPDATKKEVIKAAQAAELHDFIRAVQF